MSRQVHQANSNNSRISQFRGLAAADRLSAALSANSTPVDSDNNRVVQAPAETTTVANDQSLNGGDLSQVSHQSTLSGSQTTNTASSAESQVTTSAASAEAHAQYAVEYPSFGEAAGTKRGYDAAFRCYDDFAEKHGYPLLAETTSHDIEDDGLKVFLFRFVKYLGTTPIPVKRGNAFLCDKVKMNYLGKVKQALRDRFSHPLWATSENGGWYTEMRERLQKELKRQPSDTNSTLTRPLYRRIDNCPLMYPIDLRVDPRDEKEFALDLWGICNKLVGQSSCLKDNRFSIGPLQQRAWSTTDWSAVGRGGELRTFEWEESLWDFSLGSPQQKWLEVKTLTEHHVYWVPDRDGYPLDWGHSMASAAAVEGLLLRNTRQKKGVNSVFPVLQQMSGDQVCRTLTKVLRDNSPPHLRKYITSRSIREGAGTQLAMHPDISDDERRARAGWKAPDNGKYYFNENPAVILPGGNCLAGWDDCHQRLHWPTWECLPPESMGERTVNFIHRLIPSNLSHFAPDGELYPLRFLFAACLVMHHLDVLKDHGSFNGIVKAVNDAAQQCNITNGSTNDPVEVLKDWSAKMKKNFEEKNNILGSRNVKQALNQQSHRLSMLSGDVQKLSQTVGSLETNTQHMSNSLVELFELLPKTIRPRRPNMDNLGHQKMHIDGNHHDDAEDVIDLSTSPQKDEPKVRPTRVPPSIQKKPPQSLVGHTRSQLVHSAGGLPRQLKISNSTQKQSKIMEAYTKTAGIAMASVLERLHHNHLHKLNNVKPHHLNQHYNYVCKYHPALSRETAEVKRVLRLVAGTVGADIWAEYVEGADLSETCDLMQERAMKWLNYLEVQCGIRKDDSLTSRQRPFVVGVGKRIKKVCAKTRSLDLPLPSEEAHWNYLDNNLPPAEVDSDVDSE